MLQPGKAVKVCIYLSEGATHHGVPSTPASSTSSSIAACPEPPSPRALPALAPITTCTPPRPSKSPTACPSKSSSSSPAKKSTELLGKLEELAGTGLIEVAGNHGRQACADLKVQKCHPSRPSENRGQGADDAHLSSAKTIAGTTSRSTEALVEAMRANDIAGVTVYRGILGYGAHRRIHKDTPLHLSHHGSIMLSAIDTAEKLQAFLPIVDQMVEEGLVVLLQCRHHQVRLSRRRPGTSGRRPCFPSCT